MTNSLAQTLLLSSLVGGMITVLTACNDTPPPLDIREKINDTGITWGGNYPKDINSDCSGHIDTAELAEGKLISGDILAQQDCMRGRDTEASRANDGDSGFSYRKIDANGQPLAASAKTWHCVLDNVSGLLWEVKQPSDNVYGNSGLHDADDRFTWYSGASAENGGAIGDWNKRFDQCSGYNVKTPTTYCNTDEFLSRVNKEGWCGYTDWRIPSRPELETLPHFGRTMPAIDNTYFPNTQNEFYWSRSPVAGNNTSAWAVSFQFGFTAPLQRSNSRFVRLVRSNPTE
ncbi:Lcl C-terminal domain-containing protein [Teredinibacter purpureus]|uniref:Lcl C-terminal domain-containing protein n=1 Tax=Teredinibacter purpureus TaxID=2731756 RepID=UPI001F35E5A7|nr:DUF1566 domain-containing protein [Teredinibacter purpureus]